MSQKSPKPKIMVENISCVLPQQQSLGGLFVGNVYGAQNPSVLKQYGIRAVLTSSIETDINYNLIDIPFHMKIQAHDKENYNLKEHINQCIHFIQEARKYTNVYVHCFAGVSRSIAIICAYVMWKLKWNYQTAIAFVKAKRIVAKPNEGFVKQLLQIQQILMEISYYQHAQEISGSKLEDQIKKVNIDQLKRQEQALKIKKQSGANSQIKVKRQSREYEVNNGIQKIGWQKQVNRKEQQKYLQMDVKKEESRLVNDLKAESNVLQWRQRGVINQFVNNATYPNNHQRLFQPHSKQGQTYNTVNQGYEDFNKGYANFNGGSSSSNKEYSNSNKEYSNSNRGYENSNFKAQDQSKKAFNELTNASKVASDLNKMNSRLSQQNKSTNNYHAEVYQKTQNSSRNDKYSLNHHNKSTINNMFTNQENRNEYLTNQKQQSINNRINQREIVLGGKRSNYNHNSIPVPKVSQKKLIQGEIIQNANSLNRNHQFQLINNQLNSYMMSPQKYQIPQKFNLNNYQSPKNSNNRFYGDNIYNKNYDFKSSAPSDGFYKHTNESQRSKQARKSSSRCLVRPKDLPGYKNYN